MEDTLTQNNLLTEEASIGFDFTITNWLSDQTLDIKVLLNNNVLYENKHAQGHIYIEKIDTKILQDANQTLEVVVNDMISDYTEIDENGNILNDVLLKINNIYLDEIPLDNIVYNLGEYIPEYPTGIQGEPVLPKVQHLGWNGTWRIQFNSPIYLWLLENI